MPEGEREQQQAPATGRVSLLAEDPHDRELVFDYGFDEELNAAVKRLPRRWFDWRRKHWRVPADPRIAKEVEILLARFPEIVAAHEVLAWLSDAEQWRALVSVTTHRGSGAFVVRTLSGELPDGLEGGITAGEHALLLPFAAEGARRLWQLEGVQLDDLARACARDLLAGREPPPAELELELDDDGEPELTLVSRWDPGYARHFRRLPEAHPVERLGRFYSREGGWGVAVPADPALAP